MRAEQALEISLESREAAKLEKIRKKAETIEKLRAHPEYLVGREVANVVIALQAVKRSATSGETTTGYRVRREGRPPGAVQAAQALGEAEAIAKELRDLGYEVEVGFPSRTHDYDGDNGITLMSHVGWEPRS